MDLGFGVSAMERNRVVWEDEYSRLGIFWVGGLMDDVQLYIILIIGLSFGQRGGHSRLGF